MLLLSGKTETNSGQNLLTSLYKHQYVDDSEGDTGVSAGVIVNDEDLAKGFAHALKAEGVEVN